MDNEKLQPIIIKRVKKHKAEDHGGAWKIAYADFVTAMMAFFMLMWLLSLLNKYQMQGVSEYFRRPLKAIFTGSASYEKQRTTSVKNASTDDDDPENIRLIYPINQPSTSKIEPETVDHEQNRDGKENDVDKDKDKSKADVTKSTQANSTNEATKESKKQEQLAQMNAVKNDLEIKFKNNPELKTFENNLNFEITDDGLKVSLHDSSTNPMFELGGATLNNTATKLVNWLANEFNQVNKKLILIGHTDSLQYGSIAGFSNWELSSNRANAARQMLVQAGMHGGKVLRIEGASDINLYNKKNPYDPNNRRVDIVILNDQAAQRLTNE